MIRKTIYACRMDPIKPVPIGLGASTLQDVQLSNPFPLHNDKQQRHTSFPTMAKLKTFRVLVEPDGIEPTT